MLLSRHRPDTAHTCLSQMNEEMSLQLDEWPKQRRAIAERCPPPLTVAARSSTTARGARQVWKARTSFAEIVAQGNSKFSSYRSYRSSISIFRVQPKQL